MIDFSFERSHLSTFDSRISFSTDFLPPFQVSLSSAAVCLHSITIQPVAGRRGAAFRDSDGWFGRDLFRTFD